MGPLQDSGKLIALLVRKRVPLKDFAGISCVGCDFSGDTNLAGADFSGAVLAQADFSGAIVVGADFTDAVLAGTNFSGAHLENAQLGQKPSPDGTARDRAFLDDLGRLFGEADVFYPNRIFPNFSCAYLNSAVLRGRPLLAFSEHTFPFEQMASFDQADLSGVALNPMTIQVSLLEGDAGLALDLRAFDVFSHHVGQHVCIGPIETAASARPGKAKFEKSHTLFCQGESAFSGLVGDPDFTGTSFAVSLGHAKNVEKADLPPALKRLVEHALGGNDRVDKSASLDCSVKPPRIFR
ncbi:MAG TPA: pentapeptide repeat-containing protein [Candidatus Acidoferrum sp.]|nr:pentapeptide repeat-containing protein [Candidatus Acidoferrum sp.]